MMKSKTTISKFLKTKGYTFLILSLLLVIVSCGFSQSTKQFEFRDENLSFNKRAESLISQMTLREKISQMRFDAPAITRLGVPEYNWWNECLHGVARAGEATVFPQAIGMGATWNPSLILEMGNAVSDEARAKHHKFVDEGKRGIGQGLTFWTPNINIFRDPRWGRGQETYGEDPFLTSRIGVNYINGLQGDDDKYLKVVATAKHFAVHSGPEKSRHQDNYHTTDKDLYETYLPAFEAAVTEANVYSIMCAYNRYSDVPCCGSNLLLSKILREDWGFGGYVVSDCWAINDFWQPDNHGVVETPEEAGAMAVNNGTDLNCGNVFDPSLEDAVLKELIDEAKIDLALIRLFTARFKLGMFDAPEHVKWAKIPYDVVASDKHYALSERVSKESMVLLKNDDNILPLSKDLKSIAVIGPNADLVQSLLGNYHGTPRNFITPLKGIKEKLPNAKINYALGSDIASGWPTLKPIPSKVLRTAKSAGLKGEYFSETNFKGNPVFTQVDSIISFIWTPKRPIKDLKSDNFSVRWTGELVPEEDGIYRIGLKSSSYGKLYVNDSLYFEYHADYEPLTKYFDTSLEKGTSYKIKIEYENTLSDPQAHLLWAKLNEDLLPPAIEAAKQSDVVVLCLGLSPEIEGEEMPVKLDGFDKGDRTQLTLPAVQIELMKKIKALGKPTVLVLMNGSALAINWAADNIPAILEAWYPGEFGGKAIADVLFGDYNPSGRLPVTFYKSVNDLPDFKNYNMENRTYKYFKEEPLFAFGHGLSYTDFEYTDLIIKQEVKLNDSISISVKIKNTGKVAGDEVVQIYLTHKNRLYQPIRSLVGFQRVHLKPKETRSFDYRIGPKQYAFINQNGEEVLEPGEVEISVGGKQPSTSYKNGSVTNVLSTQVILIN
ncbi:glycoside hydrolase family 3 C-terminal domain-containing protein [Algibacter mikhailovii]|uniref:Glucan 1,4-alpha-glucosidase n=1 Tax=Algibacter mikhailovii TaxID=425498 RepID=A0A918QWE5_9FLAO|nr:glycoside hydrolase family 3 C-terminal domain-containing protein [Algibacter mikhailovii]GGZ75332.1 glucan 1,4-alpha-glucosidase [Algibacter mikhailovii]